MSHFNFHTLVLDLPSVTTENKINHFFHHNLHWNCHRSPLPLANLFFSRTNSHIFITHVSCNMIQIPYDHRCPTLITLQCVRAFLKMVPRSKDKCGLARAGEKGAITFLALYTLWLYKFVLALGTPTPLSSAHCPYSSLGLCRGRNHGEARLPSF